MKHLIMILIVLTLGGCSWFPFPFRFPSGPSNQPTKQYSHEELMNRKPKVVKVLLPSGEEMVLDIGDEIDYQYRLNALETKPKATFLDKLRALGWIGILLGVAACLCPPLAAVLGISGNLMKLSAKRIVKGVDKALDSIKDPEERERVKDALSKDFDDDLKILISKLKHK